MSTAVSINLLKLFVQLPVNLKTGKRYEEPLKPGLDKVYVHPEYTLATNGCILLKINQANETDEPYLFLPKTKERYDVGEYPVNQILKLLPYSLDSNNDNIKLTQKDVEELITAHVLAKICKHPCHLATWNHEGIHAAAEDKTCTLKYEFPNPIRSFSYNADYMLSILRVIKSFKECCTLYPKSLSPIIFTFADHQAILMPVKVS